MCHRLRHHTVSRLPRSRRRWKPVLAARIKGLNMPFFDLSGFSSLALLLVLLIYATHRLITSSHFRSSGRRLSVFFISCRFLESKGAERAKKTCRTSSHLLSDVPEKSDANVQIATTVNVFEIWSHFIHSASAPPPQNFTHHQKNIRRAEFSSPSNEFLIKESLFFTFFLPPPPPPPFRGRRAICAAS